MTISILQENGAITAGAVTFFTITNISQASSAVVTVNKTGSQPFTTGEYLYFSGLVNMTQMNGLVGQVTGSPGGSSGAYTATVNINSTGFTAYGAGGGGAVGPAPFTQSITLPAVTPGSSLHVFAAYASANGTATLTAADGVNTYSGELDAITNGFYFAAAHFIANGVAGGSTTITVTASANATNYLGIWAREIGGTSGIDGSQHGSLLTSSSTTGTNALLGPALTTSTAPGLESSFALWMNGASNFGTQVPAAGTLYVLGSDFFSIPNAVGASESFVYATTFSAGAMTWTAPTAGQPYGVWAALFVQTGVAPPPVAAFGPMPRQLYVMP